MFLTLSQTTISPVARSGAVARDLGYLPKRTTTPPRSTPGLLGWRRFLATSPNPSAHHPVSPRPAA